jgi:serine/threonine protein kinase
MEHLHRLSIVHRDLKSDNCLLDDRFNAKVADFGTSRSMQSGVRQTIVAAAVAEPHSASMTRAVGTQLWMAPEVFFGSTTYGAEVDVYSFGIIMWELATRKNPWYELGAETYIDQ